MIVAVGVDLVWVERIVQALARAGFAERVYSAEELRLGRSPERLAGRWAAKEAIVKCLAAPLPPLRDIEILKGSRGEPIVRLPANCLDPGEQIHLSISHERELAIAYAVREAR